MSSFTDKLRSILIGIYRYIQTNKQTNDNELNSANCLKLS
jgi:hypothetical protein